MNLANGELHIWRYQVNEQDYLQEIETPILSADEHSKAAEFVYSKDAIKYICNHVFRKKVLANYLSIPASQINYSYSSFGKPFVPNAAIHFSHSYRSQQGLLGVFKNAEIGIDIEELKVLQDPKTFAEFSFSAEEIELVFPANKLNEELFFTLWTFKEAFIKATGTGLNVDIRLINLAPFFSQEKNAVTYDSKQVWQIKRLEAPAGFKAAFAVKGQIENIKEFNFNEQ